MARYLICYDIADPRRLGRVHRYLQRQAMPLQYSVFLLIGDERALPDHLQALKKLINEKEDDLRCYSLPKRGLREQLGLPVMPQGIYWGVLA